jgi:hypothetical protein
MSRGDNVYRFDQGPAAQVERLRKEARGTPPGVKQDRLLRRAADLERAEQVRGWATSLAGRLRVDLFLLALARKAGT